MKQAITGVVVGLLAALSPEVADAERENSLQDGAWALQFAITDFLDVDEFGGGVSFKWHLSEKSALRFAVEGGANSSESFIVDDNQFAERDGHSIAIIPMYQRYINAAADANFFWAAGPQFQYSSFTDEARSDSTRQTRDRSSYSIGISAVVGVEWFATKDISFHAEYLGSGEYRNSTIENKFERAGQPTQTDQSEQDEWAVGTNGGVRFGFSVYF